MPSLFTISETRVKKWSDWVEAQQAGREARDSGVEWDRLGSRLPQPVSPGVDNARITDSQHLLCFFAHEEGTYAPAAA